MATPELLLTPPEAVAYLRVAVPTLAHWRVNGGGPPSLKCGRLVRYRREDLEAWVQVQQRAHTSDPGPARTAPPGRALSLEPPRRS